MMDDQFHAVLLVVAVDLLVGRSEIFAEHLRREEGGNLGAPVIVMEQCIGLQVMADFLSQSQFPFGVHIDQLMHLVGVLVEGHQAVLDLHQIMALLEDTGGDEHGSAD